MKKMFSKRALRVVLIVGILCLFVGTSIFAKLTESKEITDNSLLTGLTAITQEIGKFSFNMGTMYISMLMSALAIILWYCLQVIFVSTGTTDNLYQIPFPDTVIFNRMPLFDANFINPDSSSPLFAINSVVAGIYNSFVVIAITAFIVVTMLIGIKLVLSTIASQKAQYKKAITAWASGILILLSLQWILAGIFVINETIVQKIYDLSRVDSNWYFNVRTVASIPYIGSTLSQFTSWFDVSGSSVGLFSCTDDIVKNEALAGMLGCVPGYLGLVLKYMLEGYGGNIIGSLIAFIVMGQTVAVIFMYVKRVFFTLLLGIVGPLIVVVDTLNRSMGKNSQIFINWLKQISLTVLMQSFHAIYLYITIKMIIGIGNTMSNQTMAAIIIILLTSGLIKFEKMFKQLFGIGDSVVGDLKGSSDKAMGKIGAGMMAAKALADNGVKLAQNTAKRDDLIGRRDALRGKPGVGTSGSPVSSGAPRQRTRPSLGGDKEGLLPSGMMANSNVTNNENTQMTTLGQNSIEDAGAGLNMRAGATTGTNTGSTIGGNDDVKAILSDIRNQLAQKNQTDKQAELRAIETELGKVEGNIASAKLASIMGPANALAGMAIGIGADNGAIGATVTTALDAAAEKVGQRGADATRKALYEEAKAEGRDNPDILRKGTTNVIKQEITNSVTLKNVKDAADILSGKYNSSNVKKTSNKTDDSE